jgi:hypothetical protein
VPLDNNSVVVLALVAALVWWIWWTRRGAADAESELRKICFGDDSQVERLIDGEMRRSAGRLSRAEAARRAVERHRRDNR